MELEVRKHPTLNCLCRSDGAVFVYGNPDNHAEHWTFGSSRGNYLRVTVEIKLKTRSNTEFAEWYWNTYHMFKRDNIAQYQRCHRYYKKHGSFPVKGG